MKIISKQLFVALALMAGAVNQLHAQGTAFTYQGRLNVAGVPAGGSYDLTFTLFGTNGSGIPLAAVFTNAATPVTNGLFATLVDFGSGVFTGPPRWLEIAARTNGGGAFTTLSPRQPLSPAPYAIFAGSASNVLGAVPAAQVSGTISSAQLPANVVTNLQAGVTLGGTFSGNGGGLTNLNASALATGTVPTNVLAGFQAPYYAFIGGGQFNTANNTYAVVAGGAYNNATYLATVGGGNNNNASGFFSAIPGGQYNVAGGQFSFAAGQQAQALHQGSFVWADSQPSVFASPASDTFNVRAFGGVNFVTRSAPMTLNGVNVLTAASLGNFWQLTGNYVSAGQFLGSTNNQPVELWVNNLRALRLESTPNDATHSNLVNVVGGSPVNYIQPGTYGAVIAGGGAVNYLGTTYSNSVAADLAFIGGGNGNSIQTNALYSVLGGGCYNDIQMNAAGSVLGGGYYNGIEPDAFESFLGGGDNNYILTGAHESVLVGGSLNYLFANISFLGGGVFNSIQTNAWGSFLGAGNANSIQTAAYGSFLGGGIGNSIQTNAYDSVLGGGYYNSILPNANDSVLGGGASNVITGAYSVVPGGRQNVAGGAFSFAAGQQAQAPFQGDFVWADSQAAPFTATGTDQFVIRTAGGVGINTNNPNGAALNVNGSITSPMWKASLIFNAAGPLPKNGNITTGGGTLMISMSGSGYTPSTYNIFIGMDLKLDGVVVDSALIFANQPATHLAFVPKTLIVHLAAGSHTISLVNHAGTSTDASDLFDVTMLELPF